MSFRAGTRCRPLARHAAADALILGFDEACVPPQGVIEQLRLADYNCHSPRRARHFLEYVAIKPK